MQTKYPILGGKSPQRTFISTEEKQAQGFKPGRDKLILLFCVNAIEYDQDCPYKTAKAWAWKEKDKYQLPVFWMYKKKTWTIRTFFLN